jgi:hypothetical protein
MREKFDHNDPEPLRMFIVTEEDRREFADCCKTSRNEKFALLEFRERKLEQQDYPLDKFVADYEENSIEALQKLFIHRVINRDVEFVNKLISVGKFTLVDLYAQHVEHPKHQLLRLVTVPFWS